MATRGGNIPDFLRHHIAVVSQEPFLFTGTIRENIQYGKLDADDEAIEAAARRELS